MRTVPLLSPRFFAAVPLLASACWARAAISYASAGATYSENFNGLPKDTANNANLETVYTNGWQDDSTTVAGDHISVPGWYLFHGTSNAEGGTSGFQRLRIGNGANTGSFWGFGTNAAAADMALGSLGSATVAANNTNMYIAVRLTNDTGGVLTAITVNYDGEEWRDGQSAAAESLVFDYSTTALVSDWNTTAAYTAVPALNFSSPVFSGTATGGTAVDGNTAGLSANITATITGITWAPGTDLWLRWADNSLPTLADDGMAIDNFSFSAVPEPTGATLTGAGLAVLLAARRRRKPGSQ